MYECNNKIHLLEYDGKQHFEPNDHFDKVITTFEERRRNDQIKTFEALKHGYKIIRIDYTKLGKIKEEITNGINSSSSVYLSNPSMYRYITEAI